MEWSYLLICLIAFLTSLLTLFSGFGLSTLLMPVFALFFPLPLSIAATAVVHLLNNLFKAALVGRYADKETVIRFGLSAAIAAAGGAYLLSLFSKVEPLFSYTISHMQFHMTWTGLVIGSIVVVSALFELIPDLSKASFERSYLILGGVFSGFFGGLSGHQGMLRSAFLIKSGLNKEAFIGTSVICSLFVDAVRLLIYGWVMYTEKFLLLSSELMKLTAAAAVAAFAGAYIGSKLMKKVTFVFLQRIIGVMLMLFGILMALGATPS
jgi:uncharacterized protein